MRPTLALARLQSLPWLLAGACLVLLVGCDLIRGPATGAENRARDYLETLVREPANRERLNGFVDAIDAPTPGIESAPVRVALDYLRARHRQGASLKFRTDEPRALEDGGQRVPVNVHLEAAEARESIGFEVDMQAVDKVWRVRRLRATG